MFFAALLAMVTCSACLAAKGSSLPDAAQHPREIYQALNALRVDSARIYAVTEIRLRRDAVSFIFSDGILVLLQAYDSRRTGVVFSGRGHVSANLRDPAEKQSLVRFLGVPLLDQTFSRAYLRFDDGSDEEILDQLRRSSANPINVSADDFQKNVPDDFVLRVPIYGQTQGSKPAFLGHVVTSGEVTSFQFVTAALPKRLLIDPQMTLLCVSLSSSSPATE